MALIKGLAFSLKRMVGISGIKQAVASKTGIPTTRSGLERKIGRAVLNKVASPKNKDNR